ncbi:MAG: DNA polymerase IV [Anaerolineales bacterium]|nr:DNA polymerase IV [Anaerolineales bacterium]
MNEQAGSSPEQRSIIHLDLDAFFCAVEELRDASLRGKPFAVGGSPEGRGVVASCSYPARKSGIRSAMPMARALRLCPELIIVRHHFRDYVEMSHKVMELIQRYSESIQPISIDEAFIDISKLPGDSVEIGRSIQTEIRDHLQLYASLGIASNKLVAKIATEVGKGSVRTGEYPNAIQRVPPGEEAAFLAPLPCDALWGVGPKTAERLAELGLHTIGQIAAHPLRELQRQFGPQGGIDLQRRAQGIDNSPVHASGETKSISQEETFARDTDDQRLLESLIRSQSESIANRLRRLELYGGTVKIKLRWPDFSTITRQSTLAEPSDDAVKIEAAALQLFHQNWKPGRKLRLLGVGVSKLGLPSKQLNLWDWNPQAADKQERLDKAVRALQAEYGESAIRRAGELKAEG